MVPARYSLLASNDTAVTALRITAPERHTQTALAIMTVVEDTAKPLSLQHRQNVVINQTGAWDNASGAVMRQQESKAHWQA